ncbi:aromatic-ring-hydroxylating dioxygenase subunit beta [Mycobacterium sp.]|uniref:aromatic-ring-hydroxylating dioxygenase subunit beta n=1 Tax=Mycobacterium sp. TaxID=1785 RepID=UPI003C75BD53
MGEAMSVSGCENDVRASNATSETVRIPPGDLLYNDVLDFLYEEAELLDDDRLDEWLEMMDEGLSYRMPVRLTLARGDGAGFAPEATFFDDGLPMLTLRVRRLLETANAHSEMPPTRSRRFVSNVRVGVLGDDVLAQSSLLLLRSRWDSNHFEFLAARRDDVLRRSGSRLKLVRREILIEQSVAESPNLSVFV